MSPRREAPPGGAVARGAAAPVVANARALDMSSARNCCGVASGYTASISAAVPATIGAAKLVPTEMGERPLV